MNRLKFRLSKTGKQVSNVITCYVGVSNFGKFILCKNDVNHLLKVSYQVEITSETHEIMGFVETEQVTIKSINIRGLQVTPKLDYPNWITEIIWDHFDLNR